MYMAGIYFHPLFISITEYVKYPTECDSYVFLKWLSAIIQLNSGIVVHDIKTAVYDMFWKNENLYDMIPLSKQIGEKSYGK